MLPTVPVTFTAFDQNGNPVANARVQAALQVTEIDAGFVVPEKVEAFSDAQGVVVLDLWPNALGVNSSVYRVQAWNPDTGRKFLDTTCVVPNSPCNLHEILVQAPYPPLDASAQALVAAQAASLSAQTDAASAQASEASATASAVAASASQTAAASSAAVAASQQSAAAAQAALAVAAQEDIHTNWQAKLDAADAQATVATDQAVIATAQAVISTTQASTSTTQAGTATTARIAAEAARDAALIQAGVYVDEPTGRAAVADGVAFKVQGSGDVAAYEYRRTDASSSVLIATYPSAAVVNAQTSKIGGNLSFVPSAAIGNSVVTGSAAPAGTLWSDGASLPSGALQTVTLYVQTLGNGTGSIVVSRPGTPYTITHVVPVTGIAGTGSKTVTIPSGLMVQAGDVIGWHAATGGALIAYTGSGSGKTFATASVVEGSTFTPSGTSAKLSLSSIVGVMPEVVEDRLDLAESIYTYLPAEYRTVSTLGDSTGDTTDAAIGTIWTTGLATAAGAYLTSIELRVGVAGTGELHLIVPDTGGGGNVVEKVFAVNVAAGLNTLTLGTSAAFAACPTLPAVLYVPRGSRIAYKRLTGNGPRYAVNEAFDGASVVGDAGVGSVVTFSKAPAANIAIKLNLKSKTADPLAPSTRDSVISATATVSGYVVTVSGVLNRRGVAVPFKATATLAAPTTGSVLAEAHTIAVANTAFANNALVDNKLAFANVSAVTVKNGVTTLAENTDYLLGAEHGTVSKMGSGTLAVTVDYTYSKRRYDVISLNPETLALVVTAGTERIRDAAEFVPVPAAPALGTATPLPLFNCRVVSGLVETLPVWDVFSGQRRALITEMAEDRRRARACLRRTLAKLRQAAALTICGHGDSQTAIGSGGGYTVANGTQRDVATTGYLNTGGAVGSDVIAAQTLYDFGDGGGAIHTKLGWNWTLISELQQAYGSSISYINFGVNGESSPNGYGGTWFNPVKASGADLFVISFGQNEITSANTEGYVGAMCTDLIALGKEVIVIGVPRTNTQNGFADSAWLAQNRALRRTAESRGAAFCDLTSIYADENLGSLGILRKDMCQANLYNHPGVREIGIIGRLLASLLIDE